MAFNQFDSDAPTVALVASTPKTCNGVLAATNVVLKLLEVGATHDGATSTNAPDVVTFGRCTFATNAPGTNSSSTVVQKRDPGRAETIQATAGNTWTAEPTVITAQFTKNVAQYMGSWQYICPQTSPIILVGGKGFVVRGNSPNNVNLTSQIVCEE